MITKTLLNALIGGLRGNQTHRSLKPREVAYGDVVSVEDNLLKKYGIWTGDNFILYGEDKHGNDIVHEESFSEFLQGAEHFAVCEFPEKYGRPTEWEQPSFISSVVMPQEKIWRIMAQCRKIEKYRRYSPSETVSRAKSKLGKCGYLTSEHFAMWCKTGISESHELESIREFLDSMIVY